MSSGRAISAVDICAAVVCAVTLVVSSAGDVASVVLALEI